MEMDNRHFNVDDWVWGILEYGLFWMGLLRNEHVGKPCFLGVETAAHVNVRARGRKFSNGRLVDAIVF